MRAVIRMDLVLNATCFERIALISFAHFSGGVFIVIFVGIGLAIITLIIEYWYYKYKKPATRVDSGSKKMQVKQAIHNQTFGEKRDYETEYRQVRLVLSPK